MAFFVEDTRTNHKSKSKHVSERIDLEWIVVGIKAGLSLAEINEFRVRDLADYVDIYTGADKDKPRKATQDDINVFFAN